MSTTSSSRRTEPGGDDNVRASAVSAPVRLSVPVQPEAPPRPLTDVERRTLLRVADVLIPAAGENPKASDAPGFLTYLPRSLAARSDSFDRLMAAVAACADLDDSALEGEVRRLAAEKTDTFHVLSSVLAGTYLIVPEVRALIGYPGQHRSPPSLTAAADELEEGILDPVIQRGPIYVSAAGE